MSNEPQYTRLVFERLRESLDCALAKDSDIAPRYEIRDDGLWLKEGDFMAFFRWTPVCDLPECPESPDPSATPALPFPFTARQLAAFILYGRGKALFENFANESGGIDEERVERFLGAVDYAKPREAIRCAFLALAEAKNRVGDPDPDLNTTGHYLFCDRVPENKNMSDWRKAMVRALLAQVEVSGDPCPVPQGTVVEPDSCIPRIGWKKSVVAVWPDLLQEYRRKPSIEELVKKLRESDPEGFVLSSGACDELHWRPKKAKTGTHKTVSRDTIEDYIGKLPGYRA